MKKTLYIVSKGPDRDGVSLLPDRFVPEQDVSVVLIQDGVTHQTLPFSDVYVLSDDLLSRKLASPFPRVSYQDLLRMIFEADKVAAV